jgi:magnesium transporter
MYIRKASQKIGLSPGSLVYVGEKKDQPVHISILNYDADGHDEISNATLEDLTNLTPTKSMMWIHVSGIHDITVIEGIGKAFGLHALLLEDIVNTNHRPKIDDYDDYLFVVLKMPHAGNADNALEIEHVCIVIGHDYIILFQESQGSIFDPVKDRIKKGKGRLQKYGVDFLAYSLIDMIVDQYYGILENIGEEIESLEEEALIYPDQRLLSRIHDFKHQVMFLRKSIWPFREMISMMLRGESSLLKDYVVVFLQDVYDHVVQVIDTVETYRDLLSGIMEIYMSGVSNRMNEIMKVLTIIATLFIPLTFLAGVYGMNFRYMPELEWQFSYPVFWIVALVVFFLMLVWFRHKRWI